MALPHHRVILLILGVTLLVMMNIGFQITVTNGTERLLRGFANSSREFVGSQWPDWKFTLLIDTYRTVYFVFGACGCVIGVLSVERLNPRNLVMLYGPMTIMLGALITYTGMHANVNSFTVFFFGRVLYGVGDGLSLSCFLDYFVNVLGHRQQKYVAAFGNPCFVIGALAAYTISSPRILGIYLSINILYIIPFFLAMFLIIIRPLTPRDVLTLVKTGGADEAWMTITNYYPTDTDYYVILAQMETELSREQTLRQKLKSYLSRRALLVMFCVVVFNVSSGLLFLDIFAFRILDKVIANPYYVVFGGLVLQLFGSTLAPFVIELITLKRTAGFGTILTFLALSALAISGPISTQWSAYISCFGILAVFLTATFAVPSTIQYSLYYLMTGGEPGMILAKVALLLWWLLAGIAVFAFGIISDLSWFASVLAVLLVPYVASGAALVYWVRRRVLALDIVPPSATQSRVGSRIQQRSYGSLESTEVYGVNPSAS